MHLFIVGAVKAIKRTQFCFWIHVNETFIHGKHVYVFGEGTMCWCAATDEDSSVNGKRPRETNNQKKIDDCYNLKISI